MFASHYEVLFAIARPGCRAFRCRQARGHPSTPCDGKSQGAPPATLEGNAASKPMQIGGGLFLAVRLKRAPQPLHESGDPGAAEAPLATQGGELRRHQIYAEQRRFVPDFAARHKDEGAPAFGGGTILLGPGPPLATRMRTRRRHPYAMPPRSFLPALGHPAKLAGQGRVLDDTTMTTRPPAKNHLRRDARLRRSRRAGLLPGPSLQSLHPRQRRPVARSPSPVRHRGPLRVPGLRQARCRYQAGFSGCADGHRLEPSRKAQQNLQYSNSQAKTKTPRSKHQSRRS